MKKYNFQFESILFSHLIGALSGGWKKSLNGKINVAFRLREVG